MAIHIAEIVLTSDSNTHLECDIVDPERKRWKRENLSDSIGLNSIMEGQEVSFLGLLVLREEHRTRTAGILIEWAYPYL